MKPAYTWEPMTCERSIRYERTGTAGRSMSLDIRTSRFPAASSYSTQTFHGLPTSEPGGLAVTTDWEAPLISTPMWLLFGSKIGTLTPFWAS